MIQTEMLTVLFCPPRKKPQLKQIENNVASIEALLEGPLGFKVLGNEGICLLFNELGECKDLAINRVIQGDAIFGSCIFCRKEADAYISLNTEEIEDLENLLA